MQTTQTNPTRHSAHTPHNVGGAAYSREASWSLVAVGAIVDVMTAGTTCLAGIKLLSLSAAPHPLWPLAWAVTFAAFWFGQRAFWGVTLAERVLGLRRADLTQGKSRFGRPLRPTLIDGGSKLSATLLGLGALALLAISFHRVILRHPLWAATESWELDAYLPDMASGDWKILPFFYSLAAWPARFEGRPVLHSLPYEKGPPSRFIGHLTARWDPPKFSVTFEGPKTPLAGNDRQTVRSCLASGELSILCLKVREVALQRHLDEMSRRFHDLRTDWKIRWFEVKNAAIPPEEQAQGIYLEATREGVQLEGESRFVVITRNGTHQAFIFSYSTDSREPLARARKAFEQSIRSLRASDSLTPGRAWIDRELASVKMEDLAANGSGNASANTGTNTGTNTNTNASANGPDGSLAKLAGLAEVQALLLAKLTLDPGTFEAYFHLAGTSLMILREARDLRSAQSTFPAHSNSSALSNSPTEAISPAETALDAVAVARPNIQSAIRYAQDVAPADPRMSQLQALLIESKK